MIEPLLSSSYTGIIGPSSYVVIVVLYVVVMLGVGYWSMRRTKTVGEEPAAAAANAEKVMA